MRKPIAKLKSESATKRLRRKLTIRKKVSGTSDRPRIVVNKSNKNIRVQVIDDVAGSTMFSVQTYGKSKIEGSSNKEGAKLVGNKVAEALKGKNINVAVFDRGGYKYHGVVASLADSIRENGIQI